MSDSQEVVWEKDLAEKIDQETGESIVPVVATQNLAIARDPQEVLDEAMRAAKLLTSVINQKAHPVRFRGETYLEFEDWQTVGRFYGATVRIISTTFVTFGDVVGFEARAECVDQRTGNILSCAESMCLSDEDNWKNKPLFQLRSMAQTRAAAKALRLALGWVVVLAGYKPTPSEELDGMLDKKESAEPHKQPPEPGKHPEKAEPTKAELDALEATRKAKAAQYAKDHPQGAQAGGQAPPAGDKQEAKTDIGFVEKRNDANGGGYVTYELDNYQQEDGRFKIRFATKDATIIETLDKKFNAGERVSFEYITVPWKKGTKSGLNYEITQMVSIPEPAAAQPGD